MYFDETGDCFQYSVGEFVSLTTDGSLQNTLLILGLHAVEFYIWYQILAYQGRMDNLTWPRANVAVGQS